MWRQPKDFTSPKKQAYIPIKDFGLMGCMMSDRLAQPLSLESLQEMMKNERYWNSSHPEHAVWSSIVTNGFRDLYPGPVQRDGTGRQVEYSDSMKDTGNQTVHVQSYVRSINNHSVHVSEYDRSAPNGKGNYDRVNNIPDAPPGVEVDKNIEEAMKRNSLYPWDDFWFYDQVKNKGPWDYKQIGRKYQNFGNFNYGATGAAMGYSEETLLRMAGWAQTQTGTSKPEWGLAPSKFEAFMGIGGEAPFGDDPEDQFYIKLGIKYFADRINEKNK